MHEYYVYTLINKRHTVFYTGVTNNICRRTIEHKHGQGGKFTSTDQVHKLVYIEVFNDISEAIAQEKQIKAGSRQKKIDLIFEMNPDWEDFLEDLLM